MKFFISILLGFSFLSAASTIKVGTILDNAPFSYAHENKYKGVDIELTEAIVKRLGIDYKVNFIPMEFGNLFSAVDNNSVDFAIATISMTKQRMEGYDFSVPYFQSGIMFITRNNNLDLLTKDDLKGRVVAVHMKNSRQEKLAREIPNTKVIASDSLVNTMILVKSSRADALLIDSVNSPIVLNSKFEFLSELDKTSLEFLKQLGEDVKLTAFYIEADEESRLGILFKKNGNTELLAKVNQIITEFKNDGTIDNILKKYGITHN